MYSGSETVCARVSGLDNLFLVLEFCYGTDGAEDFFLHDFHVFRNVGEDCGLDEVSDVTVSLSSGLDLGAGLLALINVTRNIVN